VSFTVPITVQFQVQDESLLREVAREELSVMERRDRQEEAYNVDAVRFLSYAAEGRGVAHGPKGSMFTWGVVGNYTMVSAFVEALRPFWVAIYRRGLIWNFSGIVVMSQTEQQAHSTVVEISMDQTMPRTRGAQGVLTLIVREMKTPFPLFEGYYERTEEQVQHAKVTTEIWEDKP
jgi:hypothetical protein